MQIKRSQIIYIFAIVAVSEGRAPSAFLILDALYFSTICHQASILSFKTRRITFFFSIVLLKYLKKKKRTLFYVCLMFVRTHLYFARHSPTEHVGK